MPQLFETGTVPLAARNVGADLEDPGISAPIAATSVRSRAQVAIRLATGVPSGVRCVWLREVEKPSAPAVQRLP